MANIKIFRKCGRDIEIDLDNPDPGLRTFCAVCGRVLIPKFDGGMRKIDDDALFAICWFCSMFDKNGKRTVMTPNELKEHNIVIRQQERHAKVDKIRKRVAERDGKVTMRPCGCGIKGRHRNTCELSKNYQKPGRKAGV